jgi:hypothetical protein
LLDTALVTYRDIIGFLGYRVGDDGSVWSRWIPRGRLRRLGPTWHRLTLRKNRWGYLIVSLRRGGRRKYTKFVHRLVLEAFVGPCPPGCESRHLDGNPANNRLDNLRWGTKEENAADKRRHGTMACLRGSRNGRALLNEADIPRIFRMDEEGASLEEIASHFSVRSGVVQHILYGKTWRHLGLTRAWPVRGRRKGEVPRGSKRAWTKLAEADIPVIRSLRATGLSYRTIASKYGVSRTTICQIFAGKTWGHV